MSGSNRRQGGKVGCEVCTRTIRSNNKRAVFLFWRPGDRPAMVCNQRCLARYNEGEDMSDVQSTYKPGDHLPDGREVKEVDDKGKPLVVGPKPRKAKAEPVGGSVEVPADAPEAVSDTPAPAPAPKAKRAPKPKAEAAAVDDKALAEVFPKEGKHKASKAAKAPKASKKQVNTSAVAEKVAAAKAQPSPEPSATETKEDDVAAKTKKAKAAKKTPKAKKANGRKATRWTDELKAKFRAQLKAGTATYASIAKDLGVTAQTVWASLNRKK